MPLIQEKSIISLDDDLLSILENESSWNQQMAFTKKKKINSLNKNSDISPEISKKLSFQSPDKYYKLDPTEIADDWILFNFHPHILSCLSRLGLSKPTLIQKLIFSEITRYSSGILPDIICTAPTGSGKTLSFLLPIIHRLFEQDKYSSQSIGNIEKEQSDIGSEVQIHLPLISEPSEDIKINSSEDPSIHASVSLIANNTLRPKKLPPISCLILVPARELAFQIYSVAFELVKDTHVKLALLTGGISIQKQQRLLSKKVDILVSTPGRLWSHISNGSGDDLNIHGRISELSFLVIDEVDRMTEGSGHFKELWSILEFLKPRSTMVFSATFDQLKCSEFFKKIPFSAKSPLCISTSDQSNNSYSGLASSVSTHKIRCTASDKDSCLVALLEMAPTTPTIVFVNSVSMIRRLCPLLYHLGIKTLHLHSQMPQRQRLNNIDAFRFQSKGCYVLIATDAVGRGIDIPLVNRVIHFQIPPTLEQFVHRSGRTGRADSAGLAYLLISPEEHQSYIQLSKCITSLNLIKEDNGIENRLWDPLLISKIKERLEIAKYIDASEHTARKTRLMESMKANFEDDGDGKSKNEKHSKKTKKRHEVDEEAIVMKQMATSKLSKLKVLLGKLNGSASK